MAFGKIKKLYRRAFCLAAVATVALAGATPLDTARSAGEEAVYLKYNVYSSGLRIATLKIHLNYTGSDYTLTARLKTKGLLDIFSSSEFEAQTQGDIEQMIADPERFDLETDSSKGERQLTITWDSQDVPYAERSYHFADYRVADVAEHSTPGILDPLSGLFNGMLTGSSSLCTESYRVYDGRTIYDLAYSMVKRDDFGDGDAGIYRGEAYQCEILYRPVAGLSRNRLAALAEANSNGEVAYKVWMAPVASAAFGRTIHLPVGTVGSYKGNEFYMILADANISGQPLNAQSSTGD